jgi:hypothetical protein
MLKNTLLIKSLGYTIITKFLTEGLKIILLYNDVSINNVLLISMIFSCSVTYTVQRIVFCGGRFFGLSFLKYLSTSILVIQITQILLGILENNNTVKSFIEDKNITETLRKIYKYLLINISILIIFFTIVFPLRKNFIFIKNKSIDYKYSYLIFGLSIIIYILNKKYNTLSLNTIANSTVSSIPNVTNTISNNIHIDF